MGQQAKLRPLLRPLLRQHRRQHLRLLLCQDRRQAKVIVPLSGGSVVARTGTDQVAARREACARYVHLGTPSASTQRQIARRSGVSAAGSTGAELLVASREVCASLIHLGTPSAFQQTRRLSLRSRQRQSPTSIQRERLSLKTRRKSSQRVRLSLKTRQKSSPKPPPLRQRRCHV